MKTIRSRHAADRAARAGQRVLPPSPHGYRTQPATRPRADGREPGARGSRSTSGSTCGAARHLALEVDPLEGARRGLRRRDRRGGAGDPEPRQRVRHHESGHPGRGRLPADRRAAGGARPRARALSIVQRTAFLEFRLIDGQDRFDALAPLVSRRGGRDRRAEARRRAGRISTSRSGSAVGSRTARRSGPGRAGCCPPRVEVRWGTDVISARGDRPTVPSTWSRSRAVVTGESWWAPPRPTTR